MAKKEKGNMNWKEFEGMTGEVVTSNDKNIFKFSEVGEKFVGKYVSSEIIALGQGDPFTAFNFVGPKGEFSFSGGMSFESNMKLIVPGSVVRVTYDGKVKTATKGRKVNKYTIELLKGKIDEKAREAQKKEIAARIAKKNKNKK